MSAPRKTPKTKAAATAAAASSSAVEARTGSAEGLRKRVGFAKDDEQRTIPDAKVSSELRTVAATVAATDLCLPRKIDTANR